MMMTAVPNRSTEMDVCGVGWHYDRKKEPFNSLIDDLLRSVNTGYEDVDFTDLQEKGREREEGRKKIHR